MKFFLLLILLISKEFQLISSENQKENGKECTDLARDEETLLVFSTINGGFIAIDPITSETRWRIDDEPAIKVPAKNEFSYLPDAKDGSLYSNSDGGLKKLPYTIPELVASSPCRSKDGILYSGKKSDSWFIIDLKSGNRKKVLGFETHMMDSDAFGVKEEAKSRFVYLGRTKYTILMFDSSNSGRTEPWNVTYFDYSSHSMAPEISEKYEFIHVTSSGTGQTVTLNRGTGNILWKKDFSSPVVSVFLLSREGLLSVPFTTVSDEFLRKLIDSSDEDNKIDYQLFPTVYVNENQNGEIYALSSYADSETPVIKMNTINLLDGPKRDCMYPNIQTEDRAELKQNSNNNKKFIIYGHHELSQHIDKSMELQLISDNNNKKIDSTGLSMITNIYDANSLKPSEIGENIKIKQPQVNDDNASTGKKLVEKENQTMPGASDADGKVSIGDGLKETKKRGFIKIIHDRIKYFMVYEENNILKLCMIILFGLFIATFWYFNSTVRELRQQSQNGSKTGINGEIPAGYFGTEVKQIGGIVHIGKISFNPKEVLGKGCEGTFVFKGSFEQREVAVKRLLPECFTLADREVALLRESDTHENVVRYFCTESDGQFRYIAVELCKATLQDFVDGKKNLENIEKLIETKDILYQATNGLAHLHNLNIVHRDIKPQNVLLSFPDNINRIRVMISDFGLCKKLNVGKHSFSHRSGVTGTDGWIAPEMHQMERTTVSVDIFSLGCIFYFVLTKGHHPFGDYLKRQANIQSNEYDLKNLETHQTNQSVLAIDLIKNMINCDYNNRPDAESIKTHPFFWKEDRILMFLQDVSDRIEKIDLQLDPLKTLERNAKWVVRNDWNLHLDNEITSDLRKYRDYQGTSVRDLLRALRNKKHHYHELSAHVQRVLGTIPIDFTNYWLEKFPNLLLHSYHALQLCATENAFRNYYSTNYVFTKPEYLVDASYDNLELLQAYENAKLMAKNSKKDFRAKQFGKSSNYPDNNNRPLFNNRRNENHQYTSSPKQTKRGMYNFNSNQNNNGNPNEPEIRFITRDQMMPLSSNHTNCDNNDSDKFK